MYKHILLLYLVQFHQEMSSDFLVLDMFSGGGGLTEGFIRRSLIF